MEISALECMVSKGVLVLVDQSYKEKEEKMEHNWMCEIVRGGVEGSVV